MEKLCGARVLARKPARQSGNNRLYRLDTQNGPVALKVYPFHATDKGARLSREFAAYTFLANHGAKEVPKAIARDDENGYGLYQWIDGAPVTCPNDHDVDQAVGFVQTLKRMGAELDACELAPAAEACLSAGELVRQIQYRLSALEALPDAPAMLRSFLDNTLVPELRASCSLARQGYSQAGLDFDEDMSRPCRTLSPSDFGFHNSLKVSDGTLIFLDFEYFGWDDPVRLVGDFLLHPAMTLSKEQKHRFLVGVEPIFETERHFNVRLELLYPLIGIRWCLILLNEFLPERWARRAAAGATGKDAAERRQLDKAVAMLALASKGIGDISK